ncbi:MAG: TRAP transporter small permease [Deltaproteobacteria bacterium]|nr:TRAP transporter small permease [Deltaproteobacteria bacterium]
MRFLDALSDWIAKISIRLGCFFLFVMAIVLFLQVILRYLFNSGITASDEIAKYSTIWAVCLAGNVLIKESALIKVDFLDHLWPEKFIKMRDFTYQVLIIVLLFFLVIEGWKLAVEGLNSRITSLDLAWFWPYLAVPVGTFLMIIQSVYVVLKAFSVTKS